MKTLVILAIFLAIGVTAYLVVEFKIKKWKCNERGCERVFGGDFSSREQCQQQCKTKQPYHSDHKRRLEEKRRGKKVTFASNLAEYAPQ